MWATDICPRHLLYLAYEAGVDNITMVRAACACVRAVIAIAPGAKHDLAVGVLESTERWCDDQTSPLSLERLWTDGRGRGDGAFAGAADNARNGALRCAQGSRCEVLPALYCAVLVAEMAIQQSGATEISLPGTIRRVIRLEDHSELTGELF
jgi:hypothetical protein